jgi:uncharacterized membrane protein YhaH (DUF805 family)
VSATGGDLPTTVGPVARVLRALDPRGTTSAGAIWSATVAWAGACVVAAPVVLTLYALRDLEGVGRARPPLPGLPLTYGDLLLAAAWALTALVAAGALLLPCLFARRLRDAGLTTWLAALPYVALALWVAGSVAVDAGRQTLGHLALASTLPCWLAVAVVASLPTRTDPAVPTTA